MSVTVMKMPALAVVGSDHRVVRSTEGFRRHYDDAEALCGQSPEIDRVLAGRIDVATLNLGEVSLEVAGPITQRSVLDALEARYPMLRGTIRDQATGKRRAMLRFFACTEDLSHERPDTPLPEAVASGAEPFFVVGAIAGG